MLITLNKEKFEKNIPYLIIFCILICISIYAINFGQDYKSYVGYIDWVVSYGSYNFIQIEPSFYLIIKLSEHLFNDYIFGTFLIFACIGVFLKLLAIKKIAEYPYLSILVYAVTYFLIHEMTQIRVGVATGIFLLAIPDIKNRNFIRYFIKTALALSFHYSAFIMILIYFINSEKKQMLFYALLPVIGIILSLISVSSALLSALEPFLPGILSYKINIYSDLMSRGIYGEINLFNLYYSSLLIIYYFFIWHVEKYNYKYDLLYMKIFGWMLFSFYFFAFFPTLAFRISEFLGVVVIFVLPLFMKTMRNGKIAYAIIFVYCTFLLINFLFIQKLFAF